MANFDPKKFKEVREDAAQMESDDSKRNKMYDAMDALYWMTWQEEKVVTDQMKNVKVTRSPLARNSIMGAMRLLTATEPTFSVPHDINNAAGSRAVIGYREIHQGDVVRIWQDIR